MNRGLKKKLLMGVAIAAVVAAGTAAVVMAAQPAHHHHGGGTVATAAGYLGISQSRLESELHAGKSLAQIADETSGKSSAGLVAAIEATDKQKLAAAAASLREKITAKVDKPRVRGHSVTATATGYLGVSRSELRAQERSGKSLAQIARATKGKSEGGLIEALVAARKAALADEVKAGTITQVQANGDLAHLAGRMRRRANRRQGSLPALPALPARPKG